ncbi:MAG: hypothetical protein KDC73_04945 [Ignavibacteriae bacterium]|nr:hypothetical protein [Ignavibacteriota bacterium]MCB0724026.1 hypothetical protein [Ignavibacteriota bacterium]MCB9243930.1 hypothetical protein [Ignavibacteriales bacterium]
MDESIKRILKMVEEGKLSSEKAAEMIDVLKSGESTEETTPKAGKKLVIRVKKKDGEDVNINFPLKFIKASVKAFGKLPVDIKGHVNDHKVDMEAFAAAIESEAEGTIMDLQTGKGEDVRITIE